MRQGRKRLGPPDDPVVSAIEAITDLEWLEQMGEQLLDVTNGQELLAAPPT